MSPIPPVSAFWLSPSKSFPRLDPEVSITAKYVESVVCPSKSGVVVPIPTEC